MKIVIAPQAFKGTLSPFEAASAIESGIKRVLPNCKTVITPIADGGDGTLDILLAAAQGTLHTTQATNAIADIITAPWGASSDGNTAIIELARISGLGMLQIAQHNPLITSTFGVGEVIRSALDAGFRRFLIAIGGSATNDAGAGLAQALGVRLLDSEGNDLPRGGASLAKLAKIDMTGLDARILASEFIIGCDVTNPLIGQEGASFVYAPQKGATLEDVKLLDNALSHFADIVQRDIGVDIRTMPRGGAAGGAAAGMKVFLGGVLHSGSEMVLEQTDFEKHLEDANLVIVGEGCMDEQTLFNKAPLIAAQKAKSVGVPVIAVVGTVGIGYDKLYEHGVLAIIPTSFLPCSSDLPVNAAELLARAAEQAIRCWRIGKI